MNKDADSISVRSSLFEPENLAVEHLLSDSRDEPFRARVISVPKLKSEMDFDITLSASGLSESHVKVEQQEKSHWGFDKVKFDLSSIGRDTEGHLIGSTRYTGTLSPWQLSVIPFVGGPVDFSTHQVSYDVTGKALRSIDFSCKLYDSPKNNKIGTCEGTIYDGERKRAGFMSYDSFKDGVSKRKVFSPSGELLGEINSTITKIPVINGTVTDVEVVRRK